MRVEKRDGYRVIVGGPVPPQADAITLGKTIIVRARSAEQPALMAHELVHVRQFKELGPVRFALRYVGSYLRFRMNGYRHMAAYRRIPLEVEASWVSRLHSLRELEPNAVELRNRLARKKGNRLTSGGSTPFGSSLAETLSELRGSTPFGSSLAETLSELRGSTPFGSSLAETLSELRGSTPFGSSLAETLSELRGSTPFGSSLAETLSELKPLRSDTSRSELSRERPGTL